MLNASKNNFIVNMLLKRNLKYFIRVHIFDGKTGFPIRPLLYTYAPKKMNVDISIYKNSEDAIWTHVLEPVKWN